MKKHPHAYFITFTTYGTWLHGDRRMSVDSAHNVFNEKRLNPSEKYFSHANHKMNDQKFLMDREKRACVLKSIIDISQKNIWRLFAVHVRTNHVHLLVQSPESIEITMQKIKSHASRYLNKLIPVSLHQKYWTRHGSTRYIFNEAGVYPVMRYIIEDQGKEMSCFYESWYEKMGED